MLVRILVLLGAGVWSFLFVSSAFALARSPLAQVAALAVGVLPLILMARFGLFSAPSPPPSTLPSPRERERELLAVLNEHEAVTAPR